MDTLSSLAGPALRVAFLAAILILAARGLKALAPSLAAEGPSLALAPSGQRPVLDRERHARLETATFSMG